MTETHEQPGAHHTESPADGWLDDFFRSFYQHRPVDATFIGVHERDHLLPDFSEHGLGDALADAQDLLARADALEPPRDPFAAIDRRLAVGYLRIRVWELGARHFARGNPSTYTGEAVFGAMAPFLSDYAPLADRMAAATARLDGVAAFLGTARDQLGAAPPPWTERALRECDGGIAFCTDGVAALAAEAERAGAASGRVTAFRRAAEQAASAFSAFRAWLEHDLRARASDRHACGPEALDLHLREGHFLQAGAGEIARYAEDRLEEAGDYLMERAEELLARTPADALARLENRHPSAEGYYDRYSEVWDAMRAHAEDKELLTWPDFPIRYVPRPAWARAAAPHLYFLFYRAPAAFDRPDVHEYLVAPLPDDRGVVDGFLRANNDGVIKLNHVIHHGGLGHHVQNWHAYRSPSRVGRIAAVDCAARTAMHCAGTMAEGWACYATDLAAEAGALSELEEYAEVHGRVRMAARALVDVSLHQGDMSLEDAARFYASRGWSPSAAHDEAVKNSMFPGGALMYLMGTDTIHRLRSEMARLQGADFELRAFHDAFLAHGSIPVSLVAEKMVAEARGTG